MKFDEVNIRMKSYEATNTYNMLWNYADELMKDDKIATSRMVREWALTFLSKVEEYKKKEGEEMKFKPTTQTKHTYRIIFTDDEVIEVTCDSASITDEIFIGYDDGVMFFHCHMSKIKYFMKVME